MNAGLFFNPNGRITKAQFQSGALVLIAISFVFAVIPAVVGGTALMAISGVTGLIGLVMIWCWIALWVKRLHQGGITGWIVILLGLGWTVINSIVGTLLTAILLPEALTMSPDSGSFMEIMQQSMEVSRQVAIPSAIASALASFGFVFVANAALPSEDGENRYGPPPAG
jgi:uncharacterized membrane protein YhaH (DUF805 family)